MIKTFKKLLAMLLMLTMLVGMLGSCDVLLSGQASDIDIVGGEIIEMKLGEELDLDIEANGWVIDSSLIWSSSNSFISVSEDGVVSANLAGETVITVSYGGLSDSIVIIVRGSDDGGGSDINDSEDDNSAGDQDNSDNNDSSSSGNTDGNGDSDNSGGTDSGSDNSSGDSDTPIEIPADKYKNMTAEEFYADYEPAVSYVDALLRSAEGFMSGSITVPDAEPTLSEYMPMSGRKYVRNTSTYFSDGGYTYTVVDAYGREVLKIYKGGGYITLEEVAAYVYAFGDIPANYDSNKNKTTVSKSSKSEWGQYLRLNHSQFSGSTSKYPYEPELPNISGCGGTYEYYEIDIGTTGTDTGGNYSVALYNNGTKITRGAARIVYVRYDNGRTISDINDRYVFYTYNHYNDFQEYLNYYGGWGEMFGNITGGGTLSSKYDYNPTPYVETAKQEFGLVVRYTVFIPYLKDESVMW